MLFKDHHPLTQPKDWQQFCHHLSPYFSQAISRDQIDLPYWLAPLARGVIVASHLLLRRTGFKRRNPPACKWKCVRPGVYQATVGETRLRVQRMNCGKLWIIFRWIRNRDMYSNQISETLVHRFGSTPLLVRDLNEARHLSTWFETNSPIAELRWVTASTLHLGPAVTWAMRRAKDEGLTLSWNDLWVSGAHVRRMKLVARNSKTPNCCRP